MREPPPLTVAQLRALCRIPNPATLLGLRDRALLGMLLASGRTVETVVQLEVPQLVPGDEATPAWTRVKRRSILYPDDNYNFPFAGG